jgi:hypothetical protein
LERKQARDAGRWRADSAIKPLQSCRHKPGEFCRIIATAPVEYLTARAWSPSVCGLS